MPVFAWLILATIGLWLAVRWLANGKSAPEIGKANVRTADKPVGPGDDPDIGKVFVLRSGKSVEADAAFFGWSSGDIDEMRAALHTKTNPIDRHLLLQELVRQTYRLRDEPAMAELCESTAATYLQEFPKLYPVLRADWGDTPVHISVFQHYATLLTEQCNYTRAVEVCELALSKGLHDGTVSGYEGRIERIRKAAAKAA